MFLKCLLLLVWIVFVHEMTCESNGVVCGFYTSMVVSLNYHVCAFDRSFGSGGVLSPKVSICHTRWYTVHHCQV